MLDRGVAEDCPRIGPNERDRALENGHYYRTQIQGGADRLADIAERLELLDRADQFVCAFAQLAQEPRVFDRDYRLRGKALQQRDLLLTE